DIMTKPPELRRRLLVIRRDDYNRARSANPDLLADPYTTVVPVPLRFPWTDVPELVAIEDALQPGALFVRNRWADGQWVEATVAHERISVAKFNQFAAVCQQLGAHRLTVREVREVTETGKVTGSLDLRAKAINGHGQVSTDRLDRLAQSVQA